jgi:hypothetical protein
MGLNLCGAGAWNWLGARLGGATGVTRTQTVKVAGKATCPCGCKHTFDVELEVEQAVFGGVTDFNVLPRNGLSDLCMWK